MEKEVQKAVHYAYSPTVQLTDFVDHLSFLKTVAKINNLSFISI